MYAVNNNNILIILNYRKYRNLGNVSEVEIYFLVRHGVFTREIRRSCYFLFSFIDNRRLLHLF
jgi:hypothetical protein